MELKIQESIYKNRSHASCLKTAYETLLSNLWPVFKYVWPFALFYAFCAMMNGVLNTSLRVDAFQNIVNIDTRCRHYAHRTYFHHAEQRKAVADNMALCEVTTNHFVCGVSSLRCHNCHYICYSRK